MTENAVRDRFAEVLDEALPGLDEVEFADLVDECVEQLLAALAEVSGQQAV